MTTIPAPPTAISKELTQQKVSELQNAIHRAATRFSNKQSDIQLVGASKLQSVTTLRAFAKCGVRAFGENYLQEALPKLDALHDCNITWHFIGHLQRNKVGPVATRFAWIQTVDSLRLAERIARIRAEMNASPMNVCVQVNVDRESQKKGVLPEQVHDLLRSLEPLEGICLRGLMAIPAAHPDLAQRKESFIQLRALFDSYEPVDPQHWDTVSVGMSEDFIEAIECGATMVRLGTALFGPRARR